MDVQERHTISVFSCNILFLWMTVYICLRENTFDIYICQNISENLWLYLHCILVFRGCWLSFLYPSSHHLLSFLYAFHPLVRKVRFNDSNWSLLLPGNTFSLELLFLSVGVGDEKWEGGKETTWLASSPGQRCPAHSRVAAWLKLPTIHMLHGYNESLFVGCCLLHLSLSGTLLGLISGKLVQTEIDDNEPKDESNSPSMILVWGTVCEQA